MLGHDDYGVKVVTFFVVVKAVLENGVPGLRGERVAIVLAECDEEASSSRLIVRELAAVFVLSVERYVGRTLWSAAVGFHRDYSSPRLGGLSVTDELMRNVERKNQNQEQNQKPKTKNQEQDQRRRTGVSVPQVSIPH